MNRKNSGDKAGSGDVPRNAKEGRAVQKDERAIRKAAENPNLTAAEKLMQAIEDKK